MTDEDKSCTIVVHNGHDIELDPGMLMAVLTRIARHVPQAKQIDVYTSPRKPMDAWSDPGWLEWGIKYQYRGGGGLYVGAIQRAPDAEYEFHS
jgi:hypothetical protein